MRSQPTIDVSVINNTHHRLWHWEKKVEKKVLERTGRKELFWNWCITFIYVGFFFCLKLINQRKAMYRWGLLKNKTDMKWNMKKNNNLVLDNPKCESNCMKHKCGNIKTTCVQWSKCPGWLLMLKKVNYLITYLWCYIGWAW